MDRGHPVFEQNLDAGLLRCGVERLHQAVAGRHGRALVRVAGVPVWISGQSMGAAVHLARHGVADRKAAAPVRRLVDEDDAVGEQKLEGRGAVVGEGADDLAVVVAIIGGAVGLRRPTSR